MQNLLQLQVAVWLVPAAIGFIGAVIGSAVSAWAILRSQKKERQQKFLSAQLAEFYGPLLALRVQIFVKGDTRVKISGVAGRAWHELVTDAQRYGVQAVQEIRKERFPDFQKIIDHNNRQLVEELMPSYRRMIQVCLDRMHLAEQSTRAHFGTLLEFVEIWDRWLQGSLPVEVVQGLGHSEDKLTDFYQDLVQQFDRLQTALKE